MTKERLITIGASEVRCLSDSLRKAYEERDDLRKRLNNLRHEQNRWVESDQAAMRREKKALQDVADLREQLREADTDRDLCARRMKAIETAHRRRLAHFLAEGESDD